MNPASAHRINPLAALLPVRGNVCSLTSTVGAVSISGAAGRVLTGTTG
jgi:hypothetical protein